MLILYFKMGHTHVNNQRHHKEFFFFVAEERLDQGTSFSLKILSLLELKKC